MPNRSTDAAEAAPLICAGVTTLTNSLLHMRRAGGADLVSIQGSAVRSLGRFSVREKFSAIDLGGGWSWDRANAALNAKKLCADAFNPAAATVPPSDDLRNLADRL